MKILLIFVVLLISSNVFAQYLFGPDAFFLCNVKTNQFFKENNVKKVIWTKTDTNLIDKEEEIIEFNNDGFITKMKMGNNEYTVTYENNQLSKVIRFRWDKNEIGSIRTFQYGNDGMISNCYDSNFNKVIIDYVCNKDGCITQVVSTKTKKAETNITYNEQNQIISIEKNGFTLNCKYDEFNRIISVEDEMHIQIFEYEGKLASKLKIFKRNNLQKIYKLVNFKYDFF